MLFSPKKYYLFDRRKPKLKHWKLYCSAYLFKYLKTKLTKKKVFFLNRWFLLSVVLVIKKKWVKNLEGVYDLECFSRHCWSASCPKPHSSLPSFLLPFSCLFQPSWQPQEQSIELLSSCSQFYLLQTLHCWGKKKKKSELSSWTLFHQTTLRTRCVEYNRW